MMKERGLLALFLGLFLFSLSCNNTYLFRLFCFFLSRFACSIYRVGNGVLVIHGLSHLHFFSFSFPPPHVATSAQNWD
ncbi:hypothetical protein FN846DRAFT_944271 [Sphaerosporella brunnea]|uniref:Uncharacterized protein n=1 Tax=Sphaerosporella brunnea TaxID=1250544 RepID=A0A5J5F0L7_9PEZI|nr:hypothetical protein FN846DRAFT_944271 [Sphaerosporella brunnea]